jgi:hypothetical protein
MGRGIGLVIIVAVALAGCSAAPDVRNAAAGESIEVFASIPEVGRVAMTALYEVGFQTTRGESPNDTTSVFYGELSGAAGAVRNSYGGSGKVTVTQAFPGSRHLTVSAMTQSRVAAERPGAMDALKGYNYSDPAVARTILKKIASSFPPPTLALIDEDRRAHAAYEAEQERIRREQENERLAAEAAQRARANRHAEAMLASAWKCTTPLECDKAFALAQIYIDQNSDMKIQVATNTIVETFNPTDEGKIGLKVVRMPLRGQEAEVRLVVTCKRGHPQLCIDRETHVYEGFPTFMKARLQP